jgi:outer membrane protein OmpA-like peptidoglycan-associated protein
LYDETAKKAAASFVLYVRAAAAPVAASTPKDFMRTSLKLATFAALVFAPSLAAAQTPATGFALSPYNPSVRGSDWFAADSLDLRGALRPALGVVADYAARPLTFKRNDSDLGSPVRTQGFIHLGAALTIADAFRLHVNVPLVFADTGDTTTFRGQQYAGAKSSALGDVRVGGDLRLFGTYGEGVTGALGVQVFVPTGKTDAYTSDGVARIVPRFTLASDGDIAFSAFAGAQFQKSGQEFASRPSGTALQIGGAVGARLADRKLLIGPEIYGSTSTDQLFQRESSPIEAILGAHYQVASDWRLGAGAGTGITTAFGAARARVLASIDWFPAIEAGPGDRDGDGVLDPSDACPDTKGIKSDDAKKNGCPAEAPKDTDGDGILDVDDACPTVKGVASDDPKTNGCPAAPKDSDGDGIVDADDACPKEKGVKSDDPKKNGCPVKDTDGDGILDPEDACPTQPGPKNDDPKKNGCPSVRVEGTQIKILDQVKFATGSAVILKESDGILGSVAAILKEHKEIKKIRVEGHTDNRGNAAANKALSQARAAAVVKWLTVHGVEAARLSPQGFGQERAVDSNDTDAGRQNNRRVEFHIE